MATMRCPNCSSEIKKPGNLLGIILGILAFFFIGGIMVIIVCLAAVTAIGANANEESGRVQTTVEAEATNQVGFNVPVTSQDTPRPISPPTQQR